MLNKGKSFWGKMPPTHQWQDDDESAPLMVTQDSTKIPFLICWLVP